MPLLPFFFKQISLEEFLVVGQGGDFTFLSKEEFDSLLNAEINPPPPELLKLLKTKHLYYNTDKDLSINLLATKLRTRKSCLLDFTSLHMLVLTTRCNCKCNYCHASSSDTKSQNSDMDFNIARSAVDMIFQSPSRDIKIEFQGGEPLLNWEVLKKTVLYVKESIKRNNTGRIGFVICTNLMLIDEDKLKFCKDHNIDISTSLDGPKNLHDLHRKSRSGESSYDKFLEKLELTRNILGLESCNALLTITRDHLKKLRETVDEYIKLGFNGVFLRSINPYGYAIENKDFLEYSIEDFVTAYKDALDYIIELNKRGCFFVEEYASLLLQRILTPFATGFVDLQSPSGAGIGGVIYDYNGDVYPADEGRMLARMNDKTFLMGNVLSHTYEELFKGKVINNLVHESCLETLTSCATCVYQLYCGADPIRYYVECGDLRGRRPNSSFCRKNMAIFDYIFSLINKADEDTLNVFWSWITRKSLEDIRLEKN